MLIYNNLFLTYFCHTYLYFLWAGPKEACGMQTDRSTDKLKTARERGAPIPVLITFRCLRLMRPLDLRPRSLGQRPRYLCVHTIMGVA